MKCLSKARRSLAPSNVLAAAVVMLVSCSPSTELIIMYLSGIMFGRRLCIDQYSMNWGGSSCVRVYNASSTSAVPCSSCISYVCHIIRVFRVLSKSAVLTLCLSLQQYLFCVSSYRIYSAAVPGEDATFAHI